MSSLLYQHNSHIFLLFPFFRPANVIFVISTGLSYAYPAVSMTGMFIFVNLTVAFYIAVCLYFPQDFQLKVAQWLTFIFGIIMTVTLVGLMAAIAVDIKKNSVPTVSNTTQTILNGSSALVSQSITTTTSTFSFWNLAPSNIYLLFLCFLYITTAFLHGSEGLTVIHGVWFLLCLPSGYLFLMIYSVANMTDRSWGEFLKLLL